MSYEDDFENIGELWAEQDSYTDDCNELDGDCFVCPHKYTCWDSEYQNRR